MLADLRFMLGAVLAVTVLAVAGLGLATSVQLMRAAHMGPLADSRSLAYAGPTVRNAFYDPETARRFVGEKIAAPQPTPEVATPVAPVAAAERTASLPADPPSAAPVTAQEKEIPPAPTTEASAAPAPLEAAGLPDSPSADEPAPQQPVVAERVASAPAAPPPTESPAAAQAPIAIASAPQVTPSAESKPPPHPKPTFKKRIARRRLHRAFATNTNSFFGNQQFPNSSFPNSRFPTASTAWPSYNNFWGAPRRTR